MTSVAAIPNDHDFTDESPAATDKVDASTLDAQITLVKNKINALLSALGLVIRDDDTLVDEVVRLRNLHPEITAIIAANDAWQPKVAVACATTANITLSGEQTIDGVLTSASRVLVKDQTAAAENGIYVSGAGAWTRATDADAAAELGLAAVYVTAGTVAQATAWVQTVEAADITLATTALIWAQFSGTAGTLPVARGGTGQTAIAAWPTFHHRQARVATATSTTISAPGASIDGVALSVGDRVLLTGQVTTSQNGLWVWNGAAVAMTRPVDFATASTVQAFQDIVVAVRNGTLNAGTQWRLSTAGAITIDTTNHAWLILPAYSKATSGLLTRLVGARLDEVADVMDFAAVGDGVADDSAALQAAINSLPANVGGTVFLPRGSYLLGTTVTIGKGVRLIGVGLYATYIVNATAGPTPLIRTTSGDSDIEIANIQFQVANNSDVAIHVKGVSRAKIHDNRFYTTHSTGTVAIKLDQNSVPGAYNHYIEANDIQGFGAGVVGIGVLTSSVFRNNKVQSDAAFNLNGVDAGSGGNLWIGNLCQSRTGTNGTPVGNGIDLANIAGDVIVGNYFERYASAILTRAGCAGINVLQQVSYDHCTANVNASVNDDINYVDWNTDGSGGRVRFGHHSFEINRTAGTFGVKDQVNNITPWQLDASGRVLMLAEVLTDAPHSFSGNGETMEPGIARLITVNGNGAARTGAILGKTGATHGQLLRIVGNSWRVTFAATNVTFSSAGVPTFGDQAGNVMNMELMFHSSDNKWQEVNRTTRA